MLRYKCLAQLFAVVLLNIGVFVSQVPPNADAAALTVTQVQSPTCTFTVKAPVYEYDATYGWGVWAKASASCSSATTIRIVVELRKKDAAGNIYSCASYDSTKYTTSYSTKVGCPYSSGWKWQSGASFYPGGIYKQNPSGGWLSL